jgi:hypothetical protein
MPGHGNFTRVTLGPDDDEVEQLSVNGVALDDEGNVFVDVKAVYVAVAHAAAKTRLLGATDPGDPHELPSVSVPAPAGDGWTVTLDQPEPSPPPEPPATPYAVGDRVLLVGVLVENNNKPSFWHQTLQIEPG